MVDDGGMMEVNVTLCEVAVSSNVFLLNVQKYMQFKEANTDH